MESSELKMYIIIREIELAEWKSKIDSIRARRERTEHEDDNLTASIAALEEHHGELTRTIHELRSADEVTAIPLRARLENAWAAFKVKFEEAPPAVEEYPRQIS